MYLSMLIILHMEPQDALKKSWVKYCEMFHFLSFFSSLMEGWLCLCLFIYFYHNILNFSKDSKVSGLCSTVVSLNYNLSLKRIV